MTPENNMMVALSRGTENHSELKIIMGDPQTFFLSLSKFNKCDKRLESLVIIHFTFFNDNVLFRVPYSSNLDET
jgi:hypothetical protein